MKESSVALALVQVLVIETVILQMEQVLECSIALLSRLIHVARLGEQEKTKAQKPIQLSVLKSSLPREGWQ